MLNSYIGSLQHCTVERDIAINVSDVKFERSGELRLQH